jgi:hypothetical protein
VDVLVNVCCTLTEVLLNLTEVFPCFFPSCKANARVKLAKTGHGPHYSTFHIPLPPGDNPIAVNKYIILVVICVVRLLFVLFYVLFVSKCVLPPGDNPVAFNKYNMSYPGIFLEDLKNARITSQDSRIMILKREL